MNWMLVVFASIGGGTGTASVPMLHDKACIAAAHKIIDKHRWLSGERLMCVNQRTGEVLFFEGA